MAMLFWRAGAFKALLLQTAVEREKEMAPWPKALPLQHCERERLRQGEREPEST